MAFVPIVEGLELMGEAMLGSEMAAFELSEAAEATNEATGGMAQYYGHAMLPAIIGGLGMMEQKRVRGPKKRKSMNQEIEGPYIENVEQTIVNNEEKIEDVEDAMDIEEEKLEDEDMEWDAVVKASRRGGGKVARSSRPLIFGSKVKMVNFQGYQLAQKTVNTHGSTVSDTDSVLLGCGPNPRVLYESLWDGMVHALFCKAGIDFNVEEAIEGTFYIKTQCYVALDTRSYIGVNTTARTSGKIEEFVSDFMTAAAAAFTTDEAPEFVQIALWQKNAALTNSDQVVARLNPKGLKIGITHQTTMVLQNQTAAGLQASSSEDTNQLDTNPLYGRLYSGTGNCIIEKYHPNASGSTILWATVPYYQARGSVQFTEAFRHIDDKFENEKMSKAFYLYPGKMMKMKVTLSEKHFLNNWLKMFYMMVKANDYNATMYNKFEQGEHKLLHMGRAINQVTGEAYVKIAWEATETTVVSHKYEWKNGYMTTNNDTFVTPVAPP